jgi:hypothetical protein
MSDATRMTTTGAIASSSASPGRERKTARTVTTTTKTMATRSRPMSAP